MFQLPNHAPSAALHSGLPCLQYSAPKLLLVSLLQNSSRLETINTVALGHIQPKQFALLKSLRRTSSPETA